jgi:hypothetical protein
MSLLLGDLHDLIPELPGTDDEPRRDVRAPVVVSSSASPVPSGDDGIATGPGFAVPDSLGRGTPSVGVATGS